MKRFVALTLLIAVVLDALRRALVSELESWGQLLGIAPEQLALFKSVLFLTTLIGFITASIVAGKRLLTKVTGGTPRGGGTKGGLAIVLLGVGVAVFGQLVYFLGVSLFLAAIPALQQNFPLHQELATIANRAAIVASMAAGVVLGNRLLARR